MSFGMMTAMGDRLQREGQQRGWTQVELARIAALGLASVRRIEQHTFEPRVDSIRRLAAALEVSAGWLAFGDETEADSKRVTEDDDGQ
jgi:transcriptional regulator with XRE-family HTH domain